MMSSSLFVSTVSVHIFILRCRLIKSNNVADDLHKIDDAEFSICDGELRTNDSSLSLHKSISDISIGLNRSKSVLEISNSFGPMCDFGQDIFRILSRVSVIAVGIYSLKVVSSSLINK